MVVLLKMPINIKGGRLDEYIAKKRHGAVIGKRRIIVLMVHIVVMTVFIDRVIIRAGSIFKAVSAA